MPLLLVALVGVAAGVMIAKAADWLAGRYPQSLREAQIRYSVLATGIGFSAVITYRYWMTADNVTLLRDAVFAAAMFSIERVYRRVGLVSDEITLPGIVVGMLLSTVAPPGIASAAIGAVGGAGVLFLIAVMSEHVYGRESFGIGNVKLQACIGAFLGWQLAAVTFLLAAIGGGVLGLRASASPHGPKSLPFARYLCVSAIGALLVGQRLFDWYVRKLQ